jgi:hypothetical protein
LNEPLKAKVDQRRMVDDELTRLDFVPISASLTFSAIRAAVQTVDHVFVFFMTTFRLIVMTDLAGCFLRVQKVSLHRRSMCVVAHAALLESGGVVSMDLGKVILLMAIETAAFEDKSAVPVQTVALGTLHPRNRRMLVKGLKRRRRIWSNEEVHFLFAAVPQQNHRVQARRRFQCGVEHIRKGLLGRDGDTIELEFSRRRRGNQIDRPGCVG